MKASELIKELQDRIELYGDCQVIYRLGYQEDADQSDDLEIHSAYGDEDDNKIILSDLLWWDC